MLSAYIAGLNAYYVKSEERSRKQGSKRPKLDGWDQALQLAERALASFREAEVYRKDGDLDSADATTDQALLALQKRYKLYSHLQVALSLINLSVQKLCQLFTGLTSS